ncbi:MAG: mltB [Candidatus Midichloriaceae bacterium]|jgi:membrane-bound lytic murein transglycosylase B|nr:mltB [Candidatus Midichloriaceae bacterium]
MKKISLNSSLKNLVLVTSFCLSSFMAQASCVYDSFQGWKDCFVKDKLSTNANSVDIEVFQSAQFKPRVIELDRKQPEKKFTFAQYLKIIGVQQKAADGKAFYAKHRELADTIAAEYGVPASVIVALVGMESHYGTIQGNFNIVDALATLSYEGRRKNFFEKELINLLQIARNENLTYDDFKGSWAGAMGQVQFMPSSYLSYAVDYDRDGKSDIWQSVPDALASAANYLNRNGWRGDNHGIEKIKSSARPAGCGASEQICKVDEHKRLIFLKDHDTIGAFKVGKNFEILMKWNRSLYFGLGVLMIAKEIENS